MIYANDPYSWDSDDEEFWSDIVCPDGVWDLEQVKKELHDYRIVMQEVRKVYCHITGDRISKLNTMSFEVIREHDSLWHWPQDCEHE